MVLWFLIIFLTRKLLPMLSTYTIYHLKVSIKCRFRTTAVIRKHKCIRIIHPNRQKSIFCEIDICITFLTLGWGGGGGGGISLTPRSDVLEPAMRVSQCSWGVWGRPKGVPEIYSDTSTMDCLHFGALHCSYHLYGCLFSLISVYEIFCTQITGTFQKVTYVTYLHIFLLIWNKC